MRSEIGEISDELHLIIKNHKSLSNKDDHNSTFEIKHFFLHRFHNVKIQILKQIIHDPFRLRSERFYILRLNSPYPYGLKTKVNFRTEYSMCICNPFSSLYILSFPYKRGKRGKHT